MATLFDMTYLLFYSILGLRCGSTSLFRDRMSEVTKIIKHLFAVPELGVVSRNKFDIAAHILRSFFKEQTKSAQLQSLSSL